MQKEITFETKKGEIVDITNRIRDFALECDVKTGLLNLFAPHATGVLIIGEHEPRIDEDYRKLMKSIAPEGAGWEHDRIDNNAHAHLRSVIFPPSLNVPIRDGELVLGTWQSILFIEWDGDRRRRVIATVIK